MEKLKEVLNGLGKITDIPSPESVSRMMNLFRNVFFPELYRDVAPGPAEKMAAALLEEQTGSRTISENFLSELPKIKDLLLKDVAAVAHNDPAVTSIAEVVLSYPAITVMMHYRVAHVLLQMGVPLIPRIITEMAHSITGIDIHPAARIGEYFAIDHGTGIVIGATSIIGNHVMLYQGVTLGAKNFSYDEHGCPIDKPRHPILEDNVTVYSNTTILGRVTIGHDTVVGGNVWLTHDVPPYSRILQTRAITHPLFEDGAGI
ncbi:MAG: serine acetyltransferase [Bacteroidaceae bacterium]|nr:serine acetyltransferase [Bacteroidaceae bacterium]